MNLILKTWHEVVLRCLVFFIGYETLEGVKPLHINFNKINGYCTYSFNDVIIIDGFNPRNIKVETKSY